MKKSEVEKINQVVKVRLYPTPEQKRTIDKYIGGLRFIWNTCLSVKNYAYEMEKISYGLNDLNKFIIKLKTQSHYCWITELPSQSVQSVIKTLVETFEKFFKKGCGYPKYKSKKDYGSFAFPQGVSVRGNFLKVPKLGLIEAKFHRPIIGKIGTVTLSKNPSGEYHASILTNIFGLEIERKENKLKNPLIALDFGLVDFVSDNFGNKTPSPKFYRKSEKKIKARAKNLNRKERGSNNRAKARKYLAKVHKYVRNSRADFLHKLSKKLVDENQVVVVETLSVKNMVKNHKLAKSLSDAGWSEFVRMLDYKLKKANGSLIKIDKWFPSSKICNICNYKLEKSAITLNIREWVCPSCGTNHDRDTNAAINILNQGKLILEKLCMGRTGK